MGESPEIEREYGIILEALDRGVVPTEGAARELISLGFLEKGPVGYRMTIHARLKLEAIRIKQENAAMELVSADVSHWVNKQA